MAVIEWISSNITLLTLVVTTVLVVITLAYTQITWRMLRLASQPTVRIRPKGIRIHPDIPDNAVIGDSADDLGEGRYSIAVQLEVANIGHHPAQDICLDGEAYFKASEPLGWSSLPVHMPQYVSFLSTQNESDAGEIGMSVCFDNFVGRELVRDFFKGRASFLGLPVLASRDEMQHPELWPSPRIVIRCFYADIQGQEYVSQLQLFFHIWRDEGHKRLAIYLLNMGELEFGGVKRVSRSFRDKYMKASRDKRYASFSGEKYKGGSVMLLMARQHSPGDEEPSPTS